MTTARSGLTDATPIRETSDREMLVWIAALLEALDFPGIALRVRDLADEVSDVKPLAARRG